MPAATTGRTWLAMPRLSELDRGRENNLSLLRHVAATTVVVAHSFPLAGRINDDPLARLTGVIDLGTLAVVAFFAISGFLVARSFDRSPGLADFLRARALRILPAYAAAIVYAAFVVGPLVTTLPLAEYLSHRETWRYVTRNFTFAQVDRLPGVFGANPYAWAVNGSLWTLAVEVFCYGGLALAGLVGALRRRALAAALALALLAAGYVPAFVALIPHGEYAMASRLAGTFVAGALAYAWRNRIPVSPWIALAALVLAWAVVGTRAQSLVLFAALAYSTLVLGYFPAFDLPALRARTDLSYGIYVYAFPTQQLVAGMIGPGSPGLLFLLAYPAIVALAAASWRWIEAPALRFKRRPAGPPGAARAA